MKRNFLFEELQPVCTAINLTVFSMEVNNEQDFDARNALAVLMVDEYLSEQKEGIVYNAVTKYGTWVRRKMIRAAQKGFKLEYC